MTDMPAALWFVLYGAQPLALLTLMVLRLPTTSDFDRLRTARKALVLVALVPVPGIGLVLVVAGLIAFAVWRRSVLDRSAATARKLASSRTLLPSVRPFASLPGVLTVSGGEVPSGGSAPFGLPTAPSSPRRDSPPLPDLSTVPGSPILPGHELRPSVSTESGCHSPSLAAPSSLTHRTL